MGLELAQASLSWEQKLASTASCDPSAGNKEEETEVRKTEEKQHQGGTHYVPGINAHGPE